MTNVTHRTVEEAEAGWRIDRWLKHHFPTLPFGNAQRWLRTGQLRIDGRRAAGSDRLQAGEIVRVPPYDGQTIEARHAFAPPPLPESEIAFVRSLVIHEDERLLVFNKPAGLAVQGGTGTHRHLDGLLRAFAKKGERPKLVHRLDRDTSGLLVVAKTAAVARELSFAIQQHRVRKLYWAILANGPERNEGRVDLPLAKTGPIGREKVEVDPEHGGQFARTAFKVLARAGKAAAWVALLPLTGRTHQLRAHTAAIGSPIMGDGKYGGAEAHLDQAPKGLMLHARELELPGPNGKRPLHFRAEPPSTFKEALAWLGIAEAELPGASLRDWPADDPSFGPKHGRAARS